MKDRRPENPKPVKLNEVEELWVTTNYSMRPPTSADLLAVVRRGVESGEIEGKKVFVDFGESILTDLPGTYILIGPVSDE